MLKHLNLLGPEKPAGIKGSSCGDEGVYGQSFTLILLFKWSLCCKHHNMAAQKSCASSTAANGRVIQIFIETFFSGVLIYVSKWIFGDTIFLEAKDPTERRARKETGKQTSLVKCDVFLLNCRPTRVNGLPE